MQYIYDHWQHILGGVAVGAAIVGVAWALSGGGSEGSHRCADIPESVFTVCRANDRPEDSATRRCRLSGSNRLFSYYRCGE